MGFYYTVYLYPLKKQKTLSKKLGIALDNPRESEIGKVADHIKYTIKKEEPSKHEIFDPEFSIKHIAKLFLDEGVLTKKLKSLYEEENYYEFLARLHVIVRYDESKFKLSDFEKRQINKSKKEWKNNTGEAYPYTPKISTLGKARSALENYGYLITSLLNEFENYLSDNNTIFTEEPFRTRLNKPIENYPTYYLARLGFYKNPKINQYYVENNYSFGIYEKDREGLSRYANLIDSVINNNQNSKILYVANILKTCHKSFNNLKIQLVLLVSIIELLLTHSPNFRRFNVEDSINKQFQLKTSICLKRISSDIDLFSTKDNLKLIYSIRSAIAHGNFERLSKLHKNSSGAEDLDGFLYENVIQLYDYVLQIIKLYLTDREYIDFLKNS